MAVVSARKERGRVVISGLGGEAVDKCVWGDACAFDAGELMCDRGKGITCERNVQSLLVVLFPLDSVKGTKKMLRTSARSRLGFFRSVLCLDSVKHHQRP